MPSTPAPAWDLSDFYATMQSPEIEADRKRLAKRAKDFREHYENQVSTLNATALAQAIGEYETLEDLGGKLMSYAYLIYAENVEDESHSGFYQRISEQVNDITKDLLFFELELNTIPDEALSAMLQENEVLAAYRPWLRDIRVFKPYQLDKQLESLLHEKRLTSERAWNRLFNETMASLRFSFRGKQLTCTEILDQLVSPEEPVRKDAAHALGKTLAGQGRLFAMVTNVLAKDKAIEDQWRGYAQPISSRNLVNFVEDEVVTALQETVRANYPKLSHRYYALKAGWLGKDVLDYWDRNAPLPQADTRKIPWEEARQTVLEAFRNFSPEMARIGEQFFAKRWIDAAPRPGKDSGAFSHSTVPSVHPYILMNYLGKQDDVMTLAHELGHGVHQVLAAKQGPLMAETPLTLAETASVFGEQLTFRMLLAQESDNARRKALVAGKMEDMLNTVVRQIAMCEFERRVHDARKQGELSADAICDLWVETQKESFGDAVRLDEHYRYYWAYIPHFIHTPFYVYAYAFGDCLVNALYARFREGMDGFEPAYLKMLEAGGTLHHKELLAPFGLDASTPDFWQKGLDIIAQFIDALERDDYEALISV